MTKGFTPTKINFRVGFSSGLNGFFEDCQYTTYKESLEGGDKYDFHLDFDGTSGIHRKISAVLQLTDESEYEGGNLELFSRIRFELFKHLFPVISRLLSI